MRLLGTSVRLFGSELRMAFFCGKKAWGHEVALKKWPLVQSMGVSDFRYAIKGDRRQIAAWPAADRQRAHCFLCPCVSCPKGRKGG